MHHSSRLMLAAAGLALASTSVALAQTSSPMPMASPATGVMTAAPAPPTSVPSSGTTSTTAPATSMPATSAPSPTSSPSTDRGTGGSRSTDTGNGNGNGNNGKHLGQIKKLKTGTLTRSQVLYGVTHQLQAAKQLAKMKTINFDNLRVYKLPSSLKSMVKLSDADSKALTLALLGSGVQVAQTDPNLPSSNGSNSPIQYLRNVLANINVSNALNNLNVLNNSNVNVNVALSNVLNNNKISIGQVVGLYIGGGGIITTITN